MKNSIRKRRYKRKTDEVTDSVLLHNLSSIGIFVEILIGAVLGVSICFGFVLSFLVIKGSILFSTALFMLILIFAVFFVLLFKYVFLSVMLKVKEIELLASKTIKD